MPGRQLVDHQILESPAEVWNVERCADAYVFFNGASRDDNGTAPKDVIFYRPHASPSLSYLTYARSPRVGAFLGDWLFTANWSGGGELWRVHLRTGEKTSWPLPSGSVFYDLKVKDGMVYLPLWTGPDLRDREKHGIFRLDPRSGKLDRILAIPVPSFLLVPPRSAQRPRG
jgi:hypothetical protein